MAYQDIFKPRDFKRFCDLLLEKGIFKKTNKKPTIKPPSNTQSQTQPHKEEIKSNAQNR
jgi:hypothetical protein